MIKVALTGNIGSGKSTVSRIFQILNVPVFNADDEAKKSYALPDVKKEVKEIFGDKAYFADESLNRKFLAEKSFGNKQILQQLNEIIHPRVKERFIEWLRQFDDKPYIIQEAAILFESGFDKMFDKIILVTAQKETRIERIIQRDKAGRAEILLRMENQMPEQEKIKLSDYILDNNGSKMLIPQVLQIHQELIGLTELIRP